MSLIYARKIGEIVFFIADTFSENTLTNAKTDWYLNPLVKIITLRDTWVIAYAGNAVIAEQLLDQLESNTTLKPIEFLYFEHHERLALEDEYVEFAICNSEEQSLTFIKDGKCNESLVGYLGSKSGFERLQTEANSPTSENNVTMFIQQVVESVPNNSKEVFSNYLDAFVRTLMFSDGTFGGFPVSYIVTPTEQTYFNYSINIRGPLQETEIGKEGNDRVIALQDPQRGGYTLIFSGTRECFSAHFPDGQCGCIYPGFRIQKKIAVTIHKKIDPYDFTFEATQMGILNIVSTWSNDHNDFIKSHQLIESHEFQRAKKLIDSVEVRLAKGLSAKNNGKQFDFETAVLSDFKNYTTKFTIKEILAIQNLILVKERLANAVGDASLVQVMNAEKQILEELINETIFAIKINTRI